MAAAGSKRRRAEPGTITEIFELLHRFFEDYIGETTVVEAITLTVTCNKIFLRHGLKTRYFFSDNLSERLYKTEDDILSLLGTRISTVENPLVLLMSIPTGIIFKSSIRQGDVFTEDFITDYLNLIVQKEMVDFLAISLINKRMEEARCGIRIVSIAEQSSPEGSDDEDILPVNFDLLVRRIEL